jgi:hypothetical protein
MIGDLVGVVWGDVCDDTGWVTVTVVSTGGFDPGPAAFGTELLGGLITVTVVVDIV